MWPVTVTVALCSWLANVAVLHEPTGLQKVHYVKPEFLDG